MNGIKKVLLFAPHLDDIEAGCGASIAKYVEFNVEVRVVGFTDCCDQLPGYAHDTIRKEFINSMNILGVKDYKIFNFYARHLAEELPKIRQVIYEQLNNFKPDVVYMPSLTSRHEDHLAIAQAVHQVTGRRNICVLAYYLTGDSIGFCPTYFEPVDNKRHVSKRIEALKCYKSQFKIRPFFTLDNLQTSIKHWASMCGHEYVEPFEVIKWIPK